VNPYAGTPGFPVQVRPDHPKATTALVLGIVSVAGLFACVLPVVLSPFAWVVGAQARKQIRSAPQQWGGEAKATAGMVLGIVGTVLLALGVLAIALLVAIALSGSGSIDSTSV
jgi:di/tricarboxylate transporter